MTWLWAPETKALPLVAAGNVGGANEHSVAFKAEPDAGMLAEKEWQAAAQGKSGPDISLLRSLLGADEQAAAALLLAQRKKTVRRCL
ncbi:electron transfer flavoprotein subunit YgcR [Escherichia coli]|nr:electron transfer flavoprotein subunit YgcR [Escherichia coli]